MFSADILEGKYILIIFSAGSITEENYNLWALELWDLSCKRDDFLKNKQNNVRKVYLIITHKCSQFNICLKSNKKQICFDKRLYRCFPAAEIKLINFLKFFESMNASVDRIK